MATSASQGTDRVVDILEALAAARAPLSTAEIAGELGVHRSIVYRAVQTLVRRRLVRRTDDGRYALGIGLVFLASSVSKDFQELVNAELAALADTSAASVMFAVETDGEVECLLTAEPRNAEIHLAMRLGGFGGHHVERDSIPVVAMRLGRPVEPDEPPAVQKARKDGYISGPSKRWPGITMLGAPVQTTPGYANASISVIHSTGSGHIDPDDVVRTAATLSEYLVHARVSMPFSPGPEGLSASSIG